MTNAASPITITAAPPTSRRPTRWFVSHQPSGSANTIVVTSSGWIIASRPRSSAPAWSTYPTSSAAVPNSHMRWPTSRTSDIGLASETPSRLRAPFCWNVAATANRKAAMSASAAAIGRQPTAAARRRQVAGWTGSVKAQISFPTITAHHDPARAQCVRGAPSTVHGTSKLPSAIPFSCVSCPSVRSMATGRSPLTPRW